MSSSETKPRKKPSSRTLASVALQDLLLLLQDRHGGACADDDAATWLTAAVPALAVIAGGVDAPGFRERVASWAASYAPGLRDAEIETILAEARDRADRGRLLLTAAELGGMVRLTLEERERLGIKMVRPAGMSDAEFEAYRRRRKIAKDRLRRRQAGAKPRAQSLAETRPWEAEGVSRATWFRLRNKDVDQERDGMSAEASSAGIGGTVGTDPETIETDTSEHNTSTVRSNSSQAVPLARSRPWEAEGISRTTWYRHRRQEGGSSRADSSTRQPRRSSAGTGKAANDNRRLKPWQPKRGRRIAAVGNANDNTGDR